jgi:large subunit ribosomal protein L25
VGGPHRRSSNRRSDTVDLVRVRLDQPIEATVPVVLHGEEDSPGMRDGGVLEHITHALVIEALPTSIPEAIEHDVSGMSIGDTLLASQLTPPAGVTLLGELEEIVVATLTPPRLRVEGDEEIERETALVGEAPAGEAEESASDESDDEAGE